MEVFLAAVGDFRLGRGLLAFQVGDAGGTIAAADRIDVEIDVVAFAIRENTEQIAADLLARWATEAVSPPDLAERVNAGVATAVDGGNPLLQFLIIAQRVFNGSHALGGEGFVEEGFEIGVGEGVGHDRDLLRH